MNNFERLKEQVLTKSQSDDWDSAVKEWKCINVFINPNSECACGKHPIANVCVMENTITKGMLEIGNVCVKKFLGQDYNSKFQELKNKANFEESKKQGLENNKETIEEFKSMIDSNKLSEWDIGFMKEMIDILIINKPISQPRYNIINRIKRKVSGELTLKQSHQLNIIKKIDPSNTWQESFLSTIKDFIMNERPLSEKQIQYLKPMINDWNGFNMIEESKPVISKSKIFVSEDFNPLIPRPWQVEAFNKWYNEGKENASVECATGIGKSHLEFMIMQQNPKSRILVVVDTIQLQQQHKEEIIKHLHIPEEDIGFVGNGFNEINKRIVIAVVNSLRNRQDLDFDIVIMDEADRFCSSENIRFVDNNSHKWKKVLTMTALFEKEDESEKMLLDKYPIIYKKDQKEGIDMGHICEYELINKKVFLTPDEDEKHREVVAKINSMKPYYGGNPHWFMNAMAALKQGDSSAAALISANNVKKTILLHSLGKVTGAAELVMNEGKGKKIIIFSELQTSANELYTILQSEGISCQKYHSGLKIKERRQALKDFKEDKFQILIGVKCLDRGMDVPRCDMAIVIAGTSKKKQQVQRLGRVLRKPEGSNKIAIVFQLYIPETQDEVWMKSRTEPFKGVAKRIIDYDKWKRELK